MKVKMTLTPDEIQEYKSYKEKLLRARTRQEVSIYKHKAQQILNTGRARYIKSLETGTDIRVKSMETPKRVRFNVNGKGLWVKRDSITGAFQVPKTSLPRHMSRKMTTK